MNEINKTGFLLPNKLDQNGNTPKTENESQTDFSALLKDAISDVNDAQLEADSAVQEVLSGEVNNIHDTMAALQKADVSLKLMMEVRNKLLEAYQEVMRTQV